jgi:hypothetical protein
VKINPAIAAPVITAAYRLWELTLRTREIDREAVDELKASGARCIYSCWHNELFACTTAKRGKDLVTIVSRSRDGEFLARVLNSFDIRTARGSSSRGGFRALVEAVRMMRNQDRDAIITVDGPRGPRHVVKDGVIYLAQKTGAHIVPVRGFSSITKVFEKAWDRFELPLPGSRCTVVYGSPYRVTREKLTREVLALETERLREKMTELDG